MYLKHGKPINGMGRELIEGGMTLVLETAGGGGLGNPDMRDPESVENDKRAELIRTGIFSRVIRVIKELLV